LHTQTCYKAIDYNALYPHHHILIPDYVASTFWQLFCFIFLEINQYPFFRKPWGGFSVKKNLVISLVLLIGLSSLTGCSKSPTDKKVAVLVKQMQSNYFPDYQEAVKEAAAMGSPAVPALVKALKNRDERVRCGAAKALGDIGDPAAVKALVKKLKDKGRFNVFEGVRTIHSEQVCCNAARALGKIGDDSAYEHLVKKLTEFNDDMRAAAAGGLGDLKDERAIWPLVDRMRDRSYGVRIEAQDALYVLTGKDLGDEYKDWKKWYENKYGKAEK
jgi:bilin biosynthesis protein